MQPETRTVHKKGASPFTIMGLVMAVVGLVVLTIVLGVGADITQTIRDDQTAGSYAYNASEEGLEAIDNVAGWMPTLGTILVTVFVLGLLIGLFIIRLARATSGGGAV